MLIYYVHIYCYYLCSLVSVEGCSSSTAWQRPPAVIYNLHGPASRDSWNLVSPSGQSQPILPLSRAGSPIHYFCSPNSVSSTTYVAYCHFGFAIRWAMSVNLVRLRISRSSFGCTSYVPRPLLLRFCDTLSYICKSDSSMDLLISDLIP